MEIVKRRLYVSLFLEIVRQNTVAGGKVNEKRRTNRDADKANQRTSANSPKH